MRKEIVITIDDRGNPLTFKIREMAASRLESWVTRALLMLVAGSGNVDIGDISDQDQALKKLSEKGLSLLSGLDYDKVKPLLDELLSCCYRVVDGADMQVTPAVADGYIQDFKTLFKLRAEAFKLNLDFSETGGLFTSPQPEGETTFDMRTSPKLSES